ncbi:MAG TPA: hypothetical protein VJ698_12485 [Noviherbaspirillum sp.]|uniref:hypothetical protein n=1 Tax=Noviherbaspirillum sp. TaxID=1926288 RepID=UPI002B495935|nr:hypothetical protein [Noviherbaspirillum sp.]HJV86282.1 hypothetical protein [Noviherbaspirillum sp.]
MSGTTTLDNETRLLAAMAYGESSSQNVADEMKAIANVLVRQRNARGYKDMAAFTASDPTFSFVVNDGNARYAKLMNASENDIAKDPGMTAAVVAAQNALSDGPDLSNGAYFWDGADIKTNYAKHFKVRNGIRFSGPAHNIYGIDESTKLVILKKVVVKRVKGKVVSKKEIELGRYDHVYESTAAYGGTIFWKHNPDYMKVTHAKEYK